MWKTIVGVAVGLVAIVAAANLVVDKVEFGMQTDVEAKEWRDSHELSEAERLINDRVDRVQRESDRVEYDLLDPKLSLEQKGFKKRQLEKNDIKIECIRAKKC